MRRPGGNSKTKEFYNNHIFSDSVEYNFANEKYINAADIAFNMFNFSGLIYIQSFNIFHDFY